MGPEQGKTWGAVSLISLLREPWSLSVVSRTRCPGDKGTLQNTEDSSSQPAWGQFSRWSEQSEHTLCIAKRPHVQSKDTQPRASWVATWVASW